MLIWPASADALESSRLELQEGTATAVLGFQDPLDSPSKVLGVLPAVLGSRMLGDRRDDLALVASDRE
jgi:hypothetical protein